MGLTYVYSSGLMRLAAWGENATPAKSDITDCNHVRVFLSEAVMYVQKRTVIYSQASDR